MCQRRTAGRVLELPEERRQRLQFIRSNPAADMDAVDAECGQFVNDAGVGVAVVPERQAVEVRIAVDDVDADDVALSQQPLHHAVQLAELLRDRGMARRVHAGELAQAGETFQQRERIERGFGRSRERHAVAVLSIACALRATRASAGFQMRKRIGASSSSTRLQVANSRPRGSIEQSFGRLGVPHREVAAAQQLASAALRFADGKVPERFFRRGADVRVLALDFRDHERGRLGGPNPGQRTQGLSRGLLVGVGDVSGYGLFPPRPAESESTQEGAKHAGRSPLKQRGESRRQECRMLGEQLNDRSSLCRSLARRSIALRVALEKLGERICPEPVPARQSSRLPRSCHPARRATRRQSTPRAPPCRTRSGRRPAFH